MLFEIPICIVVDATSEQKAEQQVFDFLKNASKEFGTEQRIVEWQYFEFVEEEDSEYYDSTGRRNNYLQ